MPIQYDAVRPDLQRAGLAGSQGSLSTSVDRRRSASSFTELIRLSEWRKRSSGIFTASAASALLAPPLESSQLPAIRRYPTSVLHSAIFQTQAFPSAEYHFGSSRMSRRRDRPSLPYPEIAAAVSETCRWQSRFFPDRVARGRRRSVLDKASPRPRKSARYQARDCLREPLLKCERPTPHVPGRFRRAWEALTLQPARVQVSELSKPPPARQAAQP